MVLTSADLLWYLDPVLQPISLHTVHYQGSGILGSTRAVDDRTPIRRCLCRYRDCGLVRRLFQQVCAFYLALTNPTNITPSRGLHSAIFSLIGAMGFLASAVLPADAYLVSTIPQANNEES